MQMPLAPLRLQLLITPENALTACTPDCKLHGQRRSTHHNQKQQIKQNKNSATVSSGYIRKLPHIANSDRSSRRYQDKPQPRLKILSFQLYSPLPSPAYSTYSAAFA